MKALDHLKATVTSTHVSRFVRYCVAPALVLYAVSLAVMTQSGFTLIEILRDPAQQTKHSSFLGFVSSIGSWLWVAAATLCFSGWPSAMRRAGTATNDCSPCSERSRSSSRLMISS